VKNDEAKEKVRVSKVLQSGKGEDPAVPLQEDAACLTERNLELHEAYQHLEESRDRYADLYDFAPLGYLTLDESGVIEEINLPGAALLGRERAHLAGVSLVVFVVPEDRGKFRSHLRQCKKGGEAATELRLKVHGGGTIDARLVTVAVADYGRRTTHYRTALTNNTERKRMEREILALNAELAARAALLEQANHELEAFGYTVAHDLRSPLTNISGYSQALQEFYAKCLDEQGNSFLKGINREVRKMDRLIDTIFGFSRLSCQAISREAVDLSVMAQLIAAELQLKQPQRLVTFAVAEGVTAMGDAKLLRVLLDNLLGNAWKFTSRKKAAVIQFGVTGSGGEAVYFVRDNGAGFAMSQAEKIFEPFQRLHDHKRYQGHGVGLATVQRIVQRHGGRVWAEGEMGKGATFYFTLP
jgi:PAS domain S-box-containing protein